MALCASSFSRPREAPASTGREYIDEQSAPGSPSAEEVVGRVEEWVRVDARWHVESNHSMLFCLMDAGTPSYKAKLWSGEAA